MKKLLSRLLVALLLVPSFLFAVPTPVSAQIDVDQGGTGRASLTADRLITGAGTDPVNITGVSIDGDDNISGVANLQFGKASYRVGPTGSGADCVTDGSGDHTEINNCITTVNGLGGGTVELMCGDYNISGDVVVLDNIELTGHGECTSVNIVQNTRINVEARDNVSIHNFKADSSAQTGSGIVLQHTIRIYNSTNVRVYDMNLDAYAFGIFVGSATSISADPLQKVFIYNNYIYGHAHNDLIGGGPVDTTSTHRDVFVFNNHVIQDFGASGAGTYQNAFDIVKCKKLIVSGNTFEGGLTLGSEQDPHELSLVANNTVRAPRNSTIAGYISIEDDTQTNTASEHIAVDGNVVEGGYIKVAGHSSQRAFGISITGNNVRNATGTSDTATRPQNGIWLKNVNTSIVTGNYTEANGVTGTTGILLEDSTDNYVSSNYVHGYATGINQSGTYTGNDFAYNRFEGNTTNVGTNITGNIGSAATSPTTLSVIDGGGRIGIGTSAPVSWLSIGNVAPTAALGTSVTNNGVTIATTGVGGPFALGLESQVNSGSAGGVGIGLFSNDGAAMASGDRLGFMFFGGASSASALRNSAGITSFASEAWSDGSAYGSEIRFETTATGGTSRTAKLTVGNNITFTTHLISQGTAPAASSCGTSPSVTATSTDTAGKVTIGTAGPTSCTLTFATAYSSAPACTITGDQTGLTYGATTTTSTLVITSSADMSSDVLMYLCMDHT